MKNIHLQKTDKPSRLYTNNGTLHLDKYSSASNGITINQHIYITSDEEIKDGWSYDRMMTSIGKRDNVYSSKIILTTDQDLISDGVQKIDDEFLEWFVHNPSCEEVETFIDTMGCTLENCDANPCINYKIIIPKEEPKEETLEEAAAKHFNKEIFVEGATIQYALQEAFIIGAEWQAERSYSEEEVIKLFSQYKEHFSIYRNSQILNAEFQEWFEQFKKK
jgi:hypothetical protein